MKFVYSDCVHDAIGNQPVLDQFDLAKTIEFYGTSQDDYITGSLLQIDSVASARQNRIVFTASDRGKIFSKLEAGIEPALDSTFGSREVFKNSSYAARLVPWSEKVSNHYRITQCVDEKERIYDTCLPDVNKCFTVDESNIWYTRDNAEYWLSPYGNVNSASDVGYILFNAKPIASQPLSNNTWTWSFPYEEKYEPDNRRIKTQNIFSDLTSNLATNWYPASFTSIRNKNLPKKINTVFPILPGKKQIDVNDSSFKVDPSLPDNGVGSYRFLIPADVKLDNKTTLTSQYLTSSMSNEDMIRFLFGFGDLNNITYTSFTLNEDEEDEDRIISSSYFTGFELQNWSYTSPAGGPVTVLSSSYNGSPLLASGTNYYTPQFDQPSGSAIIKWLASPYLGAGNGSVAKGEIYVDDGSIIGPFETYSGYVDYPWVLVAREGFVTSSFNDDIVPNVYNYVSQSTFYSYSDVSSARASGQILTSSTAVYWKSGSSPSRQWVLGSFLSASILNATVGDDVYLFTNYKLPEPIRGGKVISTQKVEITSSIPWKLAYQRAVSSQVDNYFRTSFSGMPGLPSSLGDVDIEIERVYGTDVPFAGTQTVQTTPQILTDFTSSLYPPGEYRVNFSYVKTGVTGSTNRIDRAFIDNVQVLTFGENQLTLNFDSNYRIGYSHYPEFRQIVRDTRTSPYFPGTGLKTSQELSQDIIKKLDVFNPNAVRPKFDQYLINIVDPSSTRRSLNIPKTTAVFTIDEKRIGTLSQLSQVKNTPEILARLSLLDEAGKYLTSDSYGSYEFAYSPVIRGWKYGLYNGLPAHSRAHFRRNKFGQFRDMLEQRLFTTFFNSSETLTQNAARDTATSKTKKLVNYGVQEGPVTVKFVQQTARVNENSLGRIITAEVSPESTTSQNLTKNSSSALPYFDGESKIKNIYTNIRVGSAGATRARQTNQTSTEEMVLVTSDTTTLSRANTEDLIEVTSRPLQNITIGSSRRQ